MGAAPEEIWGDCGQMAQRDIVAEQRGRHSNRNYSVDHASEALGVLTQAQVAQVQENDKNDPHRPTYWDADCVPHWRGDLASVLNDKDKYMKARGFHDNNGFK